MKWVSNKYNSTCPFCKNKKDNFFRINFKVSNPRKEYKCCKCTKEWHFSSRGKIVGAFNKIVIDKIKQGLK